MAYEKDDGPLTEEQIQAIQKAVDDKAKAEGKKEIDDDSQTE